MPMDSTNSSIPFVHVEIPLDSIQPPDPSKTRKGIHAPADESISRILSRIRPSWQLDQCEIEVFTNGITNKIFCLTCHDEKLVFRVFGAGSEQLIDRQSELTHLCRLSQAELAPPVYATFANGLVCGFSPGHCLTLESVREPFVVDKICEKMAKMHKIPLDGNSHIEAVFLTKSRHWLSTLPSKFAVEKDQIQFDEYFSGIDLECQFSALQTVLERINSPLVFSHNDLLIYNILLDDPSGEVHFIDFEYAGPNYQLFDIGNHLCEYAGVDNPDYERDGPTEAERKLLLSRYFLHFRGKSLDEPTGELAKTLADCTCFEAASHFFWTLWAIHQANLSQIAFDYMQYAISRHRQFATHLRAQLDI